MTTKQLIDVSSYTDEQKEEFFRLEREKTHGSDNCFKCGKLFKDIQGGQVYYAQIALNPKYPHGSMFLGCGKCFGSAEDYHRWLYDNKQHLRPKNHPEWNKFDE